MAAVPKPWRAEFVMHGERELRQTLGRIAHAAPAKVGGALGEEAAIEMAEAKERTPFESGDLRRTAKVYPPDRDAEGVFVRVTYGEGLANYAIAQHEKYYSHDIGQRKYLESVIRESRPFMLRRIGRRLRLV